MIFFALLKSRLLLSLEAVVFSLIGLMFTVTSSANESQGSIFSGDEADSSTDVVRFLSFEYRGMDPVFDAELAVDEYRNPILAGYYPDPSVCRVGDKYYLVNSSFAHFPGIPIFESEDLVNWTQIGHVLDRASQLNTAGLSTSRGIFAPAITYHDGLFYVVCTQVDAGGNFYVTAEDPAGPWSEPVWLPDVGGIDPSLYFDEDGRCYLVHNDGPPNGVSKYQGHRAVYLWELDIANAKVISGPKLLIDGGIDITQEPVWIEGPHIYRVGDYFYLMAAEGGTGPQHSEVILRSEKIDGPYEPYPDPILTQRDLDPARAFPVNCTGHADLVQDLEGNWWAVFLATRHYQVDFYNTGRETFLLPVEWTEDGWPIILEAGKEVPYVVKRPDGKPGLNEADLAFHSTGNFTWVDNFSASEPAMEWINMRTPDQNFVMEDGNEEGIKLLALNRDLTSNECPSFLARRQQHTHFESELTVEAKTLPSNVSGGLALYQNENAWLYAGLRSIDSGMVELFLETSDREIRRVRKQVFLLKPFVTDELTIGVRESGGFLDLWIRNERGETKQLINALDSKFLSTAVAGGFVGTVVGMYARAE